MAPKMQIGWLGLGSMGSAMARNMQKYLSKIGSPPLCWFNRTAPRGQPLLNVGAVQCNSIEDLVSKCDIVFLSLSDDAALESITQQILASGNLNGKIVVDTTTVHPHTTKKVSEAFAEAGAVLVAAPVFGATPVAEAGTLLIAVSGPDMAVQKAKALLRNALAREVLVVSEDTDKAVLLKTIGNFMIAGIMEVLAEAHVLAEKSGIESSILEDLIQQNFGALAYSDSLRMTQGIYCPGKGQPPYSGLDLALKDVGHGISSAQNEGVKLGVGELVVDHLQKAKSYSDKHGGRTLDSSSIFGVVREEAGLDFRTDLVKARDEEEGS